MKKKLILLLTTVATALGAHAQAYCGDHAYDGEHRNEASGYIVGGRNNIVHGFSGIEASYTRHMTNRWDIGADAQIQFMKQLYSIDVQGGYRLPLKYGNAYFTGKLMYNSYHRWGFSEYTANLSATWESPYVDIRVGESLIYFHDKTLGDGYGYTEPLTFTFGFGVNIRNRQNPWNLGLFFRNYDDFYYENWNINWGVRWYARVKGPWQLFGELNVRPAGSMSQLASKYEGSMKLGVKYKW